MDSMGNGYYIHAVGISQTPQGGERFKYLPIPHGIHKALFEVSVL